MIRYMTTEDAAEVNKTLRLLHSDPAEFERMKYYWAGYIQTDSEFFHANDEWALPSFTVLSVDGTIIGALKADRNVWTNNIDSIGMISFTKKGLSREFVNGVLEIIDRLFRVHRAPMVFFTNFDGNPVQRHYERFVDLAGGRVVGTFRKHSVTRDHVLVDVIQYELEREAWFAAISSGTLRLPGGKR